MFINAIIELVSGCLALCFFFSGMSHNDSIALFRQLRAGPERTELLSRHYKSRTIWFSLASVAVVIFIIAASIHHV